MHSFRSDQTNVGNYHKRFRVRIYRNTCRRPCRNYVNYPSNVARGSEFAHPQATATSSSSVMEFPLHLQNHPHLNQLHLPPPHLQYQPPLHRRTAADMAGEEPIYVPGAYQVRRLHSYLIMTVNQNGPHFSRRAASVIGRGTRSTTTRPSTAPR